MLSLEPFHSLSAVSRLRLYLNYDGILGFTSCDGLGSPSAQRRMGLCNGNPFIVIYRWSNSEQEELVELFQAHLKFAQRRDYDRNSPEEYKHGIIILSVCKSLYRLIRTLLYLPRSLHFILSNHVGCILLSQTRSRQLRTLKCYAQSSRAENGVDNKKLMPPLNLFSIFPKDTSIAGIRQDSA